VVLRSYPVIKRVDLEVKQTTEPPPEESLPPISKLNKNVYVARFIDVWKKQKMYLRVYHTLQGDQYNL
jgi:hypothetical protein